MLVRLDHLAKAVDVVSKYSARGKQIGEIHYDKILFQINEGEVLALSASNFFTGARASGIPLRGVEDDMPRSFLMATDLVSSIVANASVIDIEIKYDSEHNVMYVNSGAVYKLNFMVHTSELAFDLGSPSICSGDDIKNLIRVSDFVSTDASRLAYCGVGINNGFAYAFDGICGVRLTTNIALHGQVITALFLDGMGFLEGKEPVEYGSTTAGFVVRQNTMAVRAQEFNLEYPFDNLDQVVHEILTGTKIAFRTFELKQLAARLRVFKSAEDKTIRFEVGNRVTYTSPIDGQKLEQTLILKEGSSIKQAFAIRTSFVDKVTKLLGTDTTALFMITERLIGVVGKDFICYSSTMGEGANV